MLYDQLVQLAAATPHQEICGLLFGDQDNITNLQEVDNVSNSLEDSFEINPQQLIAAHKAERMGGPRVIGHFHSHPNGQLSPSSRDALSSMGDGALWLIVTQGGAKCWRSDVAGAFQPVAMDIVSERS